MARRLAIARPAPAPARLATWRKLAYGVGDVIIGMRMTTFQFYLMPFYTDVAGLPAWLAGVGRWLGFVWDGVNDPLTGYVSDRTRTRLGRRRPFLLAAALPLGLTFGLVWTPPAELSPLTSFVYLLLAYVVLDTFFTLYATPYLALGAELSRDYHERTQLSAIRALFHILGLFAGGVVPGIVLKAWADDPATGHAVMGFAMGAFMIVVALVPGLLLRETPPPRTAGAPLSWRAFAGGFASTLENRTFRIMLATFAFLMIGGGLHQTVLPYAFRYWLDRREMVPGVIGVYLAATVCSLPLWTRLARDLGKDRALKLCMLWATVALAALPIAFSPDMSVLRLGLFLVLAGLGNGGWAVLPVAIVADIVDHDELTTGERREGAYFGLWTLVMKLAAGLAAGVVGIALHLLGYVANEVQTPTTVLGIRLLYGPIPALFMLVALVTFRRFPLTRERHRQVQAALAARRAS
ncbi:MAG TPA: glycoside-pentoside-hexuronide (GPH):cation symporter [Candidatus Binatia bacterium]|nr:glycoside-pentoside-hexuronide (GPH):cation symporter [Candidatus Binatia bacterium]